MSNLEAEAKKELGNAAYAAKDYDEAIKQYTAAIAVDSTNCVYYSNRSAAYAAKGDWKSSANDAQECINAKPSFIKGYYRLAKARSELNEFDAALVTLNIGLAIGGNDREQKKMMRKLKAEVKEAKAAEYRQTAADQLQGAFEKPFQRRMKGKRDPAMERKVIEQ